MKLAEWANIVFLYRNSRKQISKKMLKYESVKKIWRPLALYVLACLMFLLLPIIGIFYRNDILTMSCLIIILMFWMFILFHTRTTALNILYPKQFREHAIDRQPRWDKDNVLYYALFLEEVHRAGYSTAKIQELAKYADLVGKPTGPRLSQNLGFASLLAFIVGLGTEAVKSQLDFTLILSWILMIFGCLMAVYVYWVIWGSFYSKTFERVRVKRFLELAAHDLTQIA